MTLAPPDPGGVQDRPHQADLPPQPGELKIKERRSWHTWQLLVAILVAVIFGMWLNGDTGGGSTPSTKTSGTLPPATNTPGATGATATTVPGGGSNSSTTSTTAGGSTTTTPAGGSTTTTAAGSSTTTPSTSAVAGPARVLVLSPQSHGNWTSPAFTTTAAPWNIGWAFQCAPAPASGPSFQVFVVPAGASPSGTPAVSETGSSGQSVTAQSSLGAQTLVVQSTASCTWIVKVTGS